MKDGLRILSVLTATELFKLRKRWLPWILVGVVVLTVGFVYFGAVSTYLDERSAAAPSVDLEVAAYDISFPGAVELAMTTSELVGRLVLAILAGVVVGVDLGSRTARNTLLLGVSRAQYLIAKLVALVAATGVGLMVVVLVVIALVLVAPMMTDLPRSTDPVLGIVTDSAAAALRTGYALLAPLFLAGLLAVVTRSSVWAIAACVGYAFLSPIFWGALSGLNVVGSVIRQYGPETNLGVVMNFHDTSDLTGSANPETFGLWAALGLLSLYYGIAVALMVLLFKRRDVQF